MDLRNGTSPRADHRATDRMALQDFIIILAARRGNEGRAGGQRKAVARFGGFGKRPRESGGGQQKPNLGRSANTIGTTDWRKSGTVPHAWAGILLLWQNLGRFCPPGLPKVLIHGPPRHGGPGWGPQRVLAFRGILHRELLKLAFFEVKNFNIISPLGG